MSGEHTPEPWHFDRDRYLKRGAELSLMVVDLQADRDRLRAEVDRLTEDLGRKAAGAHVLNEQWHLQAGEIATLRADKAELEKQLSCLKDHSAEVEIQRLEHEKAELVEVLRPFAKYADLIGDRLEDGCPLDGNLCAGDLRNARAALAKATTGDTEV